MEKLVELLNNFIDRNYKNYWHRNGSNIHTWRTIVISKEFRFIKDLVENDHVDLDWFPQIEEYSDYESLLMMLSIQDDPIKYLISILK